MTMSRITCPRASLARPPVGAARILDRLLPTAVPGNPGAEQRRSGAIGF
jgi:hypothetical protein